MEKHAMFHIHENIQFINTPKNKQNNYFYWDHYLWSAIRFIFLFLIPHAKKCTEQRCS